MKKYVLLSGAAACALGIAVASKPAQAFDEVNWVWNTDVNKTVTEDFNITADLVPSGLVTLEDLQIFIGDVIAYSETSNIYNNQPAPEDEDGEVTVDGQIVVTGNVTGDGGDLVNGNAASDNPELNAEYLEGSIEDVAGDDPFEILIGFSGTFQLEPEGSFDALTELPEVINAATAVGNNVSIDSDVAMNIHEGQFVFGDGSVCGDEVGTVSNSNGQNGCGPGEGNDLNLDLLEGVAAFYGFQVNQDLNSNLVLATTLTAAATLGLLDKAEIHANAYTHDIYNATVDNTATAVANNKSITLDAATADDAVLIGDITQFAYANVSATANTHDVYLNNYTNLGELDRAIVNNVATAVGNNLSVTVSSPLGNGDE